MAHMGYGRLRIGDANRSCEGALLCPGLKGPFTVAAFPWNQWQLCYGTSGRFRAEYAKRFGMHAERTSLVWQVTRRTPPVRC